MAALQIPSGSTSTPTREGRRADDSSDAADPLESAWSVHVRFPSTQGARLRRSEPTRCPDGTPLWAERPILMERADGTYELMGPSAHLSALARWILSHGADAKVEGPDRLRRRVAAEAKRILRLYREGG